MFSLFWIVILPRKKTQLVFYKSAYSFLGQCSVITLCQCSAIQNNALCCTVLHCTVLNCTQRCNVLYNTILYCTLLHCRRCMYRRSVQDSRIMWRILTKVQFTYSERSHHQNLQNELQVHCPLKPPCNDTALHHHPPEFQFCLFVQLVSEHIFSWA